jgi:predicted amidohydrolase YtcJ
MSADLIVCGGRAVCCDGAGTVAAALAVRDGRITAVGSQTDVLRLRGPGTRTIDLAGGSVLPGIIDSHLHLAWWALASPPVTLDLRAPAASSLADVQALVTAAAAERPAGTWIRGRGWREDALAGLSELGPRAVDLDAVAPEHPVALEHWSYHALWANRAALAAAGVTRSTPDPDGGAIVRDPATGEPTGVLHEAAADLVRRAIPEPSAAERRAAIAAAARRLLALGVTSITDPCVTPELARDYIALRRDGELPLRVGMLLHWDWPSVTSTSEGLRRALRHAPVASGLGDERLYVAGVKLFADGVPTLGTAWMSQPYAGGTVGSLVTTGGDDAERVRELRALVLEAHRHRLQVQVHATGDRACAAVADAFVDAIDADPWDARHVVIHANFLSAADARRLAARGCGANVNMLIKWQASDTLRPLLDDARWQRNMPARTLVDAGLHVADSSDAPISDPDWRQGVETLVRRRARGSGALSGPAERLTREQGLRAWTAAAAYHQHAEHVRGTLEPGKIADLVVLAEDVLEVPDEALHALTPVVTVLGGEVVHETAGGQSATNIDFGSV